MAKTVGFGKLEREVLSNQRLPLDVRVAVVEFKNSLKVGWDVKTDRKLVVFENEEGGLPRASAGQFYYEYQVGQAHRDDSEPRGKRRLAALVDAGLNILKIYLTDDHYTLGHWRELQYP